MGSIVSKYFDPVPFEDFQKQYKKEHRIDYAKAMAAYQKDPMNAANPDDLQLKVDVVAAHVKDKAGFVEAVAKHFVESAAKRHTLDPVDPLGDLEHLFVKGDIASGLAKITILPKVAGGEGPLKPGQSPAVYDKPFKFRRVNGGWLLDSL